MAGKGLAKLVAAGRGWLEEEERGQGGRRGEEVEGRKEVDKRVDGR